MPTDVDRPRAVRPGEEVDGGRTPGLLAHGAAGADRPLEIRQFPSGYSNLTYAVSSGTQEFVLRRPPFARPSSRPTTWGRSTGCWPGCIPSIPRRRAPSRTATTPRSSAPFYVMERVNGVILRAQPAPTPADLPLVSARRLGLAVVDELAAIHALDVDAAGLADLGRPAGYIARQIDGWTRRYQRAQTDGIPQLDAAASWLHANLPAEADATLIHNDYKHDNVVLAPDDLTRVIAVLDWEMCTLGDPRMDLGTTLGYWIEPDDPPALAGMFGLTTLPGTPTRADVVRRYGETSGRDVGDPLFFYVYGVFKIAVIVQQIYARYRQGHTQDPRFAPLIHVVRGCGEMAAAALASGRISQGV
ncbi:MAG: phosphotransferase family protein [Caldilineaceae bacterium]